MSKLLWFQEMMKELGYEPVRHGKWIVDEDGNIECSECGCHGVGDNYCERCGARMDGNELEDIHEMRNCYHALGGNGFLNTLMKKVEE